LAWRTSVATSTLTCRWRSAASHDRRTALRIDPDEPCPCGADARYADCHGHPDLHKEPEIGIVIPLQVIPEPDPGTRAVFQQIGDDTILFQGTSGSTAYICGRCSEPLVVGVPLEHLVNLVLACSSCGAFNETQAGQ